MEVIVDIVLAMILGYALAKLIIAWFEHKLMKHLDAEIGHVVRDLDSGQLIPLTVEQHNEIFLCYNSITNEFVCQGTDLYDIARRFNERYPGKNATIHRGDTEVLRLLKKQMKPDSAVKL